MPEELFEELHEDHETVKGLVEKLSSASSRSARSRESQFEKLKMELLPHMKAEEKVFYAALLEQKEYRDNALEALEEHHVAELVLRELDRLSKSDEKWAAKLLVFKEIIEHHIEKEEGEVFNAARRLLDEERLEEIFEGFQKNKQNIKDRMQRSARAAA